MRMGHRLVSPGTDVPFVVGAEERRPTGDGVDHGDFGSDDVLDRHA